MILLPLPCERWEILQATLPTIWLNRNWSIDNFVPKVRKAKQERARLSVPRIPPVLLPTLPANPHLAARLHNLGGGGSCRCSREVQTQALRSADHWSLASKCSPKYTEQSILNAYKEAIRNANHFIYIENQFYISWMEKSQRQLVQNGITQAIYDRVVSAYR